MAVETTTMNRGYAQDDAEDDETGCGGWGGEWFWYMGRTQCFRANAAYSLYGVLKGETVPSNPCSKGTFINSFFTTFGVESFAGPLGIGVDDANSKCEYAEPAEGADGGDYSYAMADDDYLDDGYQFYNWKAYTSYGTGCSAEGAFTRDSYQGAFCHGRNYIDTINTLNDFNEAISNVQCQQIYYGDNNDDDDDDDDAEENNGERALEEQESYDFEEMDAVQILAFSKSCSLRQYPKDCPDPYGRKKHYGKTIDRALMGKTGSNRDITPRLIMYATAFCFLVGIALLVWAFVTRVSYQMNVLRKEKKERRRRRRERRRLRKGQADAMSKGEDATVSEHDITTTETDNDVSIKVVTKRQAYSPKRKLSGFFKKMGRSSA